MAFGESLANLPVSGAISLGGTIYNLIKGNQAKEEVDAQSAQAMSDLRAQLAFEAVGRSRISDKATELDALLSQVMQQLGAPSTVSASDIDTRARQLTDNYIGDVDRAGELVASQNFADSRSRGMDVSTQMTDAQAAIAAKLADSYSDARTRAYGDAVTQLTGADTLLNNSRTNTMNQYATTKTLPINAYQAAFSNSPVGGLSNMVQGANQNSLLAGQNQGTLYRQLAESIGGAFKNADGTPMTLKDITSPA